MADIKISELGAASAVNNTDLFPMTSAGVTVKATAQQLKNYMGVGNIADLATTDKSSAVAAINEVNTKVSKSEVLISNSGDAYSPTRPYKVGELCIYNNVLYRCTTACSAGSWTTNQSCFIQDTLVNVASYCYSNTNKLLRNSLGDLNSDSAIEAAVLSFANNYMENYVTFSVSFNVTASGTHFQGGAYVGFVTRFGSARVTVRYIRGDSAIQMRANYNNGTWTYL